MTVEDEVEAFRNSLEHCIETLQSAEQLLQKNSEIIRQTSADREELDEIKKLQKNFIIDSFKINKFHKDYKEWENIQTSKIINSDVRNYNKKFGKMSRLNSDIEELDKDYEKLRQSIKLPNFKFSIQTIQKYDDGSLLKNIVKDENDQYPSVIELSQLFSLDPKSGLPSPDYKLFSELLNIEYRLRIERRIKYEILLVVKSQLTSNNRKWTLRDTSLNEFMTRKLIKVIEEVEKIKKSEYEDLKDFDYYNDEDEDDDDGDIEQEIEEEEDDVNHKDTPDESPQEDNEEENQDQDANQDESEVKVEGEDENREGNDHATSNTGSPRDEEGANDEMEIDG